MHMDAFTHDTRYVSMHLSSESAKKWFHPSRNEHTSLEPWCLNSILQHKEPGLHGKMIDKVELGRHKMHLEHVISSGQAETT